MKSEFTTAIWLATFDTETELRDYVDWKYSDNEDGPTCTFADDIGLTYFDSDFLESVFVEIPSELLEHIDHISFAENFKAQLVTSINNINYADKNAIISISGKKDMYGSINEDLFDFVPMVTNKKYVQFVGLFKYENQ